MRPGGAAIHKLLELDLKPRDIMTREAFENAMVLVTVIWRIDQCGTPSDRDREIGSRPLEH